MSRESSLWSWLKQATRELREQLHMCRVENSVWLGMADVEGQLYGDGQFWIELKSSARPAKPETPVRFKVKDREAQVQWLTRRWKAGGAAWLLLQVGSATHRKVYLVAGLHAAEVYEGVTEQRLMELDWLNMAKPTPVAVVRKAAASRSSDVEEPDDLVEVL